MIFFSPVLLVSRNDKYSRDSIVSFLSARINENIERVISTTVEIESELILFIKSSSNTSLISHQSQFDSLFEHMSYLTKNINCQYISFLHDDDLISIDYLVSTFKVLSSNEFDIISSKVFRIDKFSKTQTNIKSRRINKVKKITYLSVLFGYFFPFIQTIFFPTIVYKRIKLLDYWSKYPVSIGIYEDVRIVYYFSKYFKFIEFDLFSKYLYRFHSSSMSGSFNKIQRLRLIAWLKSLSINKIVKSILITGAFLQYFIYYKESTNKFSYFILRIRRSLINLRSGGSYF